jgi:phage portal protein BeeE
VGGVAGLLDRVAAAAGRRVERRGSIDTWISDYLIPSSFGYGQPLGLSQSLVGQHVQEVAQSLPGYMAALRASPPAFAAQLTRALVLSQARFTFRNRRTRALFGTTALEPLETPWPNATTGQMLTRMEWHAGLAGNAYVHRRPGRLRVLRPDWVAIVFGSDQEPEDAATALDGEVIGYAYVNGGLARLGTNAVHTLLPDEVAHWSPVPDPERAEIGMSWLTPALRDMQGDRSATEHKLRYFINGATPNMVIKGIPAATKQQFDDLVAMMEAQHAGVANAYKTLYLTAGADATVVGSDLTGIDFSSTQGAGETRIAMLSLVHPVILAAAEGLKGAALNAGNFSMARRIWADKWIYPTLQDLSAALAPLLQVPSGAELWPDTADMPLLREDARDAADIEAVKATTIRTYTDGGFDPDSAVAAVAGQDITLLKHSGLLSVQLNPPGGPAGIPAEQQTARNLVEMIQKVYLGVGTVITEDEARELLNRAGASLPIPGPDLSPTPALPAGG